MVSIKETKSKADKYSMEDDISCYMCSDEVLLSFSYKPEIIVIKILQVNLGDDYRGHLDAAHGIKKNFNYFMQQVSITVHLLPNANSNPPLKFQIARLTVSIFTSPGCK